MFFFFFQAEDGIRDYKVTGVQTCALPIWLRICAGGGPRWPARPGSGARRRVPSDYSRREVARARWLRGARSEEHTSELQSPCNLVCRLLLEKKKKCQFRCVCVFTH